VRTDNGGHEHQRVDHSGSQLVSASRVVFFVGYQRRTTQERENVACRRHCIQVDDALGTYLNPDCLESFGDVRYTQHRAVSTIVRDTGYTRAINARAAKPRSNARSSSSCSGVKGGGAPDGTGGRGGAGATFELKSDRLHAG